MAKQGKGILDGLTGKIGNITCRRFYNKSFIQSQRVVKVDNGIFTQPYKFVAPINDQNCVVGDYYILGNVDSVANVCRGYLPFSFRYKVWELQFRATSSNFQQWFLFFNDSINYGIAYALFGVMLNANRLYIRIGFDNIFQYSLNWVLNRLRISVLGNSIKLYAVFPDDSVNFIYEFEVQMHRNIYVSFQTNQIGRGYTDISYKGIVDFF